MSLSMGEGSARSIQTNKDPGRSAAFLMKLAFLEQMVNHPFRHLKNFALP
jgi:hypothetical protein